MLEAALQRIHSAAEHSAIGVLHAVLHGYISFGILGCDTKDAGKPHPKNSAWTAAQKARSNTDDVARTDSCSERCGKGAELRNVTLGIGVVLRDREFNRRGDLPLNEAGPDGHEEMGAQQQPNKGPAPYETIDGIDASRERFDECLHGYFLSTRLTRKGSVPIGSASLRSGGFAICTR